MDTVDWLQAELARLRSDHLDRRLAEYPATAAHLTVDGRPLLNFASNDYLDLARHPHVVKAARAALESFGAGATASRLLTGTLPLHAELERRLAAFKGYPAALVFGSGYLTNAGVVGALVQRQGHVFVDRLAHASIVDAAIQSRARLHRFRHNDAGHLDALLSRVRGTGRRLVITESVFSMDGDLAPLGELAEVSARYDALLMVDEAHATGVFGPQGCGLIRARGLVSQVALSMGTLSKALGGYGGFIACSQAFRDLIINRARAFIYTTAPPPAAIGAALGALDVVEKEAAPGQALLEAAARFRRQLQSAGLNTLQSVSQIVPVLAGRNEDVMRFAAALREAGVLAAAIRPPTVPPGGARLRFSLRLAHTGDDLDYAAGQVIQCARKLQLLA